MFRQKGEENMTITIRSARSNWKKFTKLKKQIWGICPKGTKEKFTAAQRANIYKDVLSCLGIGYNSPGATSRLEEMGIPVISLTRC
jgi:hypothetical protein